MSQNDLVIANQTFPATRADINSALQAVASLNSGSTAPTTTYANMLWYDTGTNTLKMRSEADDAWISVGYLDQAGGAFRIFDDTQVVNSGGTQTGLIGDQTTATWEAGTGATESLVSPLKIKAAIDALAPAAGGMFLLGTVATTSGSSVSVSALDLTGYKLLRIRLDNVDPHNALGSKDLSVAGVIIADTNQKVDAIITVDLVDGWSQVFCSEPLDVYEAYMEEFTITTATTSVSVATTGTFGGGSVTLYGIK